LASTRDAAAEWTLGQLVPGTVYRLVRRLGKGGMGEVYEVEHTMLGCPRALKVLAGDLAGRNDLAERLRAEARGLARLNHPNIVEVFDLAFAADGRIFLVMELLQGRTLRALLREQRKLSPSLAVRTMAQVLDGLAAAHAAQLIHRDVKPENIFVCPNGVIKLLDFGIAKAVAAWTSHAQLTAAGMTLGTPRYMAPEQIAGKPVDARTDVYAVGLVLWEVLAGRAPFDDTDPAQLADNKRHRGVPSLADAAPGLDPTLAAAVMQACAREPAQRFPTASAFAAEIRKAVGEPLEPWALARTPTPEPLAARPATAEATAIDPGEPTTRAEGVARRRDAASAQDPVHGELTERMEAISPVDRDAPTRANPEQGPVALGPTGTRMLPAVAARRAAASHTGPAPADDAPALQDRAAHSRLSRIATAAFLAPIVLVAAVGAAFAILRQRPEPLPSPSPTIAGSADATPPVRSTPDPAQQPSASPAAAAAVSASSSPAAPASACTAGKTRSQREKPPSTALPATGL
jgi:eukaryotic-like serine/threonine-protein kinase